MINIIISFDCETYEKSEETGKYVPVLNTNKFYYGGIAYRTARGDIKYVLTNSKEELKEEIMQLSRTLKLQNRRLWIYAHNAMYDYLAIFKEDILKHKIVKMNPLICCINQNTWIIDTMGIYARESVETIGKKIGIEKGIIPKEVEYPQELDEYLKKDLEVVLRAVEIKKEELQQLGMNPRKLMTAGQIAISNFVKWCKDNNRKEIIRFNAQKKRYEIIGTRFEDHNRQAYKIGRNEAFQIGKFENVTVIDENRLFPYSMTQIEMPDLTDEYYSKNLKEVIDKKKMLTKYTGVIYATLNTGKYRGVGYLPVRKDKYLYFPKENTITGWFTIPEVAKAVEYGYELEEYYSGTLYRKTPYNPFKEYFKRLYEIELEKPQLKGTIKTLMNNVHGKLGMKTYQTEVHIGRREDASKLKAAGWQLTGSSGEEYLFEKKQKIESAYYCNVLLSSLTVSKAREIMHEEYQKVREEDLLYSDTDSLLITNFEDYRKKFEISNQMGKFKILYENVPCEIRKEKMYKIGTEIKSSGISPTIVAEQGFNSESYSMPNMISIKDGIKMGNYDKIGTFTTEIKHITERMKNETELPYHIIEDIKKD